MCLVWRHTVLHTLVWPWTTVVHLPLPLPPKCQDAKITSITTTTPGYAWRPFISSFFGGGGSMRGMVLNIYPKLAWSSICSQRWQWIALNPWSSWFSCYYRSVLSSQVYVVLGSEPRASWMLRKHSYQWNHILSPIFIQPENNITVKSLSIHNKLKGVFN